MVFLIGFSAAGLALLTVAVTTVVYGIGFTTRGPRPRLLREWAVIPIESPVVQIIGGVCLAIAGSGFLWLAYKVFTHSDNHTSVK